MYRNREDAGRILAEKLAQYKSTNAVVLAIPRGGVPVGYIIASELNLPLDLALSKKIGHPSSSELAIGSVTLHGSVTDERIEGLYGGYIERETERIMQELKRKKRIFMGDQEPIDLRGKTVIITDDGVATGNTMLATIKAVRSNDPLKVVVAVPVAPPSTARKLRKEADELICSQTPVNFYGVGQFFDDFSQVSDDEVRELFKRAHLQQAGD